jgi:hypothetical protein
LRLEDRPENKNAARALLPVRCDTITMRQSCLLAFEPDTNF